jgi:hypothetical protein
MRFDRRVTIFLVISAISFLLTPISAKKYQHVPPIVGTIYLVLAILFFFDWLGRRNA